MEATNENDRLPLTAGLEEPRSVLSGIPGGLRFTRRDFPKTSGMAAGALGPAGNLYIREARRDSVKTGWLDTYLGV